MVDISNKYYNQIESFQKLSNREYSFALKDLPGSPWELRIKAIGMKHRSGTYYTKGSLSVRRTNESNYYDPRFNGSEVDRIIKITLNEFLHSAIAEIKINASYGR